MSSDVARDGETRYRNVVIERCGWWVRLYLGGTSKPDRFRWWRSDLSRGTYLRLRGEQVIGCQWRRSHFGGSLTRVEDPYDKAARNGGGQQ